ncbi:MAG TPA: hypothetical protein VGQ99_12835 [Tepidisphaeraceae bacterium]|jgi:hypothetical protein|nr:hypothetical protein [Tepidisphaeraceae bacterium]
MANWVVSAHGGAEKKTGGLRQILAPTEKFKYGVTLVPSGLTLVMFTAQAQVFVGGDPELDALIAGNENDPTVVNRIHKLKTAYAIVPDYRAYGTNDFRSGIYAVGSNAKVRNLPDGSITKLSDIFTWAKQDGTVRRIYWLACTVFA